MGIMTADQVQPVASSQNVSATEDNQSVPPVAAPVRRQVLYTWKAPQRHFKKMDKKQYFTILACVLALCVILVILGQYGLMIAILAVMFLLYAIGTVPPIDVAHTLTTIGIETAGQEYAWKDMKDYWFSMKDAQIILNIDTNLKTTGRVIMLADKKDAVRLHSHLKQYLAYKDFRRQNRISEIIYGTWVDLFENGTFDDFIAQRKKELVARRQKGGFVVRRREQKPTTK